jgi:hypothetical protein
VEITAKHINLGTQIAVKLGNTVTDKDVIDWLKELEGKHGRIPTVTELKNCLTQHAGQHLFFQSNKKKSKRSIEPPSREQLLQMPTQGIYVN